MNFNKVVLGGNLTKNPELKNVGDSQVCNMSMAINKSYVSKQTGEKVESTTFVELACWGKVAENCAKFLQSGSPILAEGELQMQTWTDKETGKNRSKLSVKCHNVQFLHKAPPKDNSADYTNPEIDTEEMEPAKGEEFETPVDENEVPF